jgi:PhzF family phenazine biosynthesis protein
MRIPYYQVDAFTARTFGGNPAGVCVLESWLPDDILQRVAAENNLAETAFFIRQADDSYHLRWFTPVLEVDLCGHATLASAFVLFTELGYAVRVNGMEKFRLVAA